MWYCPQHPMGPDRDSECRHRLFTVTFLYAPLSPTAGQGWEQEEGSSLKCC